MKDLNYYGQLDELVRQETNVEVISRPVAKTEKGDLCLVWDGSKYYFELGGKDVSTPQLMETAVKILERSYPQAN